MLTNSFARMLWISPVLGALCCFVGMNLAYHLDTSASATVILVGALTFVGVYVFTGIRGRSRIAALHHV